MDTASLMKLIILMATSCVLDSPREHTITIRL